MPDTSTATELVTHYSSQLSTDLERNMQEQDKIRIEIEELRGRLTALQHDHAVLATMRHALENGIPLQQSPSSPSVPDVDESYDYGLSVAGSTATRRRQQKPTLVALIRAYLAEQVEPCSAAEVATALSETHPDRIIKTTVVRTTLEGLVARSSAQRLKQGHSVFYTGLEAGDGTDSEDGDEEESAED
jgi:hypothetical protein